MLQQKRKKKDRRIEAFLHEDREVWFLLRIPTTLSMRQWITKFREIYRIKKEELFEFGVKYVYQIHQDIQGMILIGDFVKCYYRAASRGKPKTINNKNVTLSKEIKLYHIEYLSKRKAMIFFHFMDDAEDAEIKTDKVLNKHIKDAVRDQFPAMSNLKPIGK